LRVAPLPLDQVVQGQHDHFGSVLRVVTGCGKLLLALTDNIASVETSDPQVSVNHTGKAVKINSGLGG
jgi:hypothetical protein